MPYKAIAFDKDGTLIDFHASWLPIYQNAALTLTQHEPQLADALLSAHGYDPVSGRFSGGSLLAAGTNHDIAKAWAEQLSQMLGDQNQPDYCQQFERILQQRTGGSATGVPQLKDTIWRLKCAGFKLGITTSDSRAGIFKSLQSFEILDYFDFLCGYDSGYGVKPEAGMVRAFCRQVAVDPEQTIVVGDNRHDIEMGRNAGAGLCVGVLTGTSTRAELEPIADRVYADITSLLTLADASRQDNQS